jgi:hypothetical protein
METYIHPGEIFERFGIGTHHRAISRFGRRCDYEVVSAAWASPSPDIHKQERVLFRYLLVIVDNRHGRGNVIDESGPFCPSLALGEDRSHTKLRQGDSGDGNVVLIVDQVVEVLA